MAYSLRQPERILTGAGASQHCVAPGRDDKPGRTQVRVYPSCQDDRPAYVFGKVPPIVPSQKKDTRELRQGERREFHSGAQRGASSVKSTISGSESDTSLVERDIKDSSDESSTRYMIATPSPSNPHLQSLHTG